MVWVVAEFGLGSGLLFGSVVDLGLGLRTTVWVVTRFGLEPGFLGFHQLMTLSSVCMSLLMHVCICFCRPWQRDRQHLGRRPRRTRTATRIAMATLSHVSISFNEKSCSDLCLV